jgi:pimeloyl-ACP methyl ester carboxylesterase
VDGRPVRSLSAGRTAPDLPELVVVPGLGAVGYLVPLVRACAGWTRVHLLDLPGFGHPLTARLPADLATVSRALTGWLAEVPDAPVALLGHSTGAQAALAAAHDRVALLVLAGVTFPPPARRVGPLVARVARTLPSEQLGQLAAVLPYYRRGRHRLPGLLASALRDAPEQALGRTPPLVVLRGSEDHLCDEQWAAALASRAPDGRSVTVPGGHNAPYTVPDLTAQVLRDGLRMVGHAHGEGVGAARSRAAQEEEPCCT